MPKTLYLSMMEKWKKMILDPDQSQQEGWLPPTKRASAAKIN